MTCPFEVGDVVEAVDIPYSFIGVVNGRTYTVKEVYVRCDEWWVWFEEIRDTYKAFRFRKVDHCSPFQQSVRDWIKQELQT